MLLKRSDSIRSRSRSDVGSPTVCWPTKAAATERLAAFAGLIIDNHGVDGVVNGVATSTMDFAGVVRAPQTGKIRNYVLFTAVVVVAVLIVVLLVGLEPSTNVARAAEFAMP